jgi:hypothetical protein
VRERERERERVCVCVRERERESARALASEREKRRKKGREKGREKGGKREMRRTALGVVINELGEHVRLDNLGVDGRHTVHLRIGEVYYTYKYRRFIIHIEVFDTCGRGL